MVAWKKNSFIELVFKQLSSLDWSIHEISSRLFKNHWKSNFKMLENKREEEWEKNKLWSWKKLKRKTQKRFLRKLDFKEHVKNQQLYHLMAKARSDIFPRIRNSVAILLTTALLQNFFVLENYYKINSRSKYKFE